MDRLILVLLFGLAAPAFSSDICHDRMNIILPKVVISGRTATTLVHFHDKHEQHNVTFRLARQQSENPADVLAQNTVVIKGDGVAWLNIPNQDSGIYNVQILLDCVLSDENCSSYINSKVKLSGSIRDVIIRPSSNYYRPGETIEFWILAIDHDLHAPTAALAKLYVRDPSGKAQAVWEDVPLFEGTKKFRILISERAPLGEWTIEVLTEGNLYSSELNVSLARGSNQLPNREQVVTEKHFVELHFSDKMRRKYKPGLPLMGKIEAVSSEEEVRIRVKVIDDQRTVLYSQDIDMTGREGNFIVPAVITNTDQITVQAELISLDGKDVDSQYVLARETLQKWNSESNCYLLIKELRDDLKPDENVQMTVLTSCPCSNNMHYVVSTEGQITVSGELTLTNQTNVPVILDSIMQGVNIYEFSIFFSVEAKMAPTSNLLVYYFTESGEIIGDSISFNVKLQHEKVRVVTNENNVWYAEENIKVGLSSFPKTHVCLAGGRVDDTHLRVRRQSRSDHQSLEDNLTFLTSCGGPEETFQLPKHESYFPNAIINQLWLWKCFNYTDETESNGVTLPPTNGPEKWKLWALSLSDTVELRVSDPVTINVFSPIDVHFELPTTVKLMEIVQVEITISSNMNSCIDIHALIALSEGAIYPGIDVSIVSEKLRLGGHGATSIVVRIQPVTPGLKTMTANVTSYVREGCEEPTNLSGDFDLKAPITSISTVSGTLEATNEGIDKVYTNSVYFCANEDILTLDGQSMQYSFITAPRKEYSIKFDVMASENFHILLTEDEDSTKNVYQIHLGDYFNSVSWIGRGKNSYEVHLSDARTPDLLSGMMYQTFWLRWENSIISVGQGGVIGDNSFLTHVMDRKMKVNFIGFATSFGTEGRVRISKHNDESGYSQVLRLDVPHRIISGSEKGTLYLTGGLALPFIAQELKPQSTTYPFSSLGASLSSLNAVLLMEANIWDTKWMQVNYNKSYAYEETQKNIQNLLLYLNKDYSFSDHPNISDYSNTIKAFEVLSRAQYHWKIDSDIIASVRKWIIGQQREDGHFEIKAEDTIEEKLITTAETLITFLEIGLNEIDQDMINKGYHYLRDNQQDTNDTYALSTVGYAFMLLNSTSIEAVLSRMHIPMRTEEKDNEWQNSQSSSVSSPFDWLYDKEKHLTDKEKQNLTTNLIADYKSAIYAALIHSMRKDINKAEPIIKYIFYRSNILNNHPELSHSVTKALATFAVVSRDVHPSLTVSLATSGMELTDTLELKSDSMQHSLDLPSLPTKVFIYATGSGCATLESKVKYLTYDTEPVYSLDFVSFIEEEIPAHYNVVGDPEGLYPQLILKSCFRLTKPSMGLKIEAVLFSGYRLDSILSVSPSNVDLTHGFAGERAWFTFANVSADCGICIRYLITSSFIISALRPIYFRIYELESPHIVRELFVHSTNKDSLLRTDIIDAHFITWFGSQSELMERDDDLSRFQQCESLSSTQPPLSHIFFTSHVFAPRQLNNTKLSTADSDGFNNEDNATTLSPFETTSFRTNETSNVSEESTTPTIPFSLSTLTTSTLEVETDNVSSAPESNHSSTAKLFETTTKLGERIVTQVSETITEPEETNSTSADELTISKFPSTMSTVDVTAPTKKPVKGKKTYMPVQKEKPTKKMNFKNNKNDSMSKGTTPIPRRKDINKVVVGQNELNFDTRTEASINSILNQKNVMPMNDLQGILRDVSAPRDVVFPSETAKRKEVTSS